MALAAARVSTVAERLSLLPGVAQDGAVGADARGPTGTSTCQSWTGSAAISLSNRLADGKNNRAGGEHSYDGSKKLGGRKRHILVDMLGLLLKVKVHAADILDRDGARHYYC